MEFLSFLNPWILSALTALPALWFLLKVTPPSAKKIILPTAHFLKDLQSKQQTQNKIPWWLLLLRMIIAALVIFAFSEPLYNDRPSIVRNQNIRLIIDNGWASAQIWDQIQNKAEEIITQTEQQNGTLEIITTADYLEHEKAIYGPFTAAEAKSFIGGLSPKPWPKNYRKIAKTLTEDNWQTIWLSDGVMDDGAAWLVRTLDSLQIFQPSDQERPVLLRLKDNRKNIQMIAQRDVSAPQGLKIQALGKNGKIFDQQDVIFPAGSNKATIDFALEDQLQNAITQYRLTGRHHPGAGGVFLLDDSARKRSVGIYTLNKDTSALPLTSPSYFLKRALEPYADLSFGNVDKLIKDNPSVIILADVAALPLETIEDLNQWVRNGGLLLRFAGPKMAEAHESNFLLPIQPRSKNRALGGALTWETPLTIAPFEESSPLFGLKISDETKIKRQILANPEPELDQKSWARLEDGTPLITADYLDNGLLVFIHTTATTEWSDFVLSGLFVETLRKIVSLSGSQPHNQAFKASYLEPSSIIDGYGSSSVPSSSVKPIDIQKRDDLEIGPEHPPGLYGRGGQVYALNIGNKMDTVPRLDAAINNISFQSYTKSDARNFKPTLLVIAGFLFLLDWLIILIMQGAFRKIAKATTYALFLFVFVPSTVSAQDIQKDAELSKAVYLGYVTTGQAAIDATTQIGLDRLVQELNRRTAAGAAGALPINIEQDDITLFPFIYWPISTALPIPTSQTLRKIEHYLNNGGMILFDTREKRPRANADHLQSMMNTLDTPSLTPIPDDHVLYKSFYLLKDFPGRYTDGTFWVEGTESNKHDGVSSVLLGNRDWASAWALQSNNRSSLEGGTRQYELSIRFGVNLVIYALTGNYKADQVHIQQILKRLGQ